jgi:hypothetical protein
MTCLARLTESPNWLMKVALTLVVQNGPTETARAVPVPHLRRAFVKGQRPKRPRTQGPGPPGGHLECDMRVEDIGLAPHQRRIYLTGLRWELQRARNIRSSVVRPDIDSPVPTYCDHQPQPWIRTLHNLPISRRTYCSAASILPSYHRLCQVRDCISTRRPDCTCQPIGPYKPLALSSSTLFPAFYS